MVRLSLHLVELGIGALAAASVIREQIVLGPSVAGLSDGIREKLKEAEIIPDVIVNIEAKFELKAIWGPDNSASLGNTLEPDNLQDAPTVILVRPSDDLETCARALPEGVTRVLTLTDPDAPSRDNPEWSEMCHWIASGVSIYDSEDGAPSPSGCAVQTLDGLEDVMPYKAPGPPAKTGKHRYVFLVWVPGNGTTEKLHLTKPGDRQHWGGKKGHGVQDWAREHGLTPIAANFIYAQNEKQ